MHKFISIIFCLLFTSVAVNSGSQISMGCLVLPHLLDQSKDCGNNIFNRK